MNKYHYDDDRRRLLRAMGASGLLAELTALLPAYARTAGGRVPGRWRPG